MTLKNLRKVNDMLLEFNDFFAANADGDESGFHSEISNQYEVVAKIMMDEFYKIHLRNAVAKNMRINKTKKLKN